MLLNFTLKYAIMYVQESKGGLELVGHQFLVYADDANLLGENMKNVKKNRKVFSIPHRFLS